jgi:hypothetical protein
MTRDYRKTFKSVRILVAGKYKTVHTVLGAGNALLEFPMGDVQRTVSRAVLDNLTKLLHRRTFVRSLLPLHPRRVFL